MTGHRLADSGRGDRRSDRTDGRELATGTFILTSGRSGSTFLARTLRRHPELVVVSDLIEPVTPDPYFDGDLVVDGAAFWDLLSRPALPERIAHWRDHWSEELLYLPDRDADVSLLMAYTLPFLAADPWELRAELAAAMRARGPQPAPDHFIGVLDFLRDRSAGTAWVERTGGSLPHTARIVGAWPEAKYVWLRRDPVETALSMRTGSFFRLCRAAEEGRRSNWLDPEYACPVGLVAMIERWTIAAEEAVRTLPSEQVFEITYERLIEDPVAALAELIGFLLGREPTTEDDRWARERALTVSGAAPRASDLPAAELGRVREACSRAFVEWETLRQRGR